MTTFFVQLERVVLLSMSRYKTRVGKRRLVGSTSDRKAKKQITDLVEHNGIVPAIDSRTFTIDQVTDALALMSTGHLSGKVLIAMDV